jgi:hypothetical protein
MTLGHSYFGGLQAPSQTLVGTGIEFSEKNTMQFLCIAALNRFSAHVIFRKYPEAILNMSNVTSL